MSQVQKHFDVIAADYDFYKQKNWFYYAHLKKLLTKLIPRNKNVLEIGCATGDLLASLKPRKGYGIDISSEMIRIAKSKQFSKKLHFSTQSVIKFKNKKLDYIFMSDVIEHLEGPQKMFNQIAQIMRPSTILVNTMINPLWEPVLMAAEKLGLKMPEGNHFRWSSSSIERMIKKAGLHLVGHDYTLLIPAPLPLIAKFANKYLEPFLKPLAFIEYFIVTKP